MGNPAYLQKKFVNGSVTAFYFGYCYSPGFLQPFWRCSKSHRFMAGHMYLLETATMHYKTACTSDRKTTILPLLALGTALHEYPWSPEWIEARKEQRFDALDPLMPALSEVTDQWLSRPMTTGEA